MLFCRRDGKKDGFDNFVEYQIFIKSTKNSGMKKTSSTSGDMSTFGEIGCAVSVFVITALLFSGTDLDNKNKVNKGGNMMEVGM